MDTGEVLKKRYKYTGPLSEWHWAPEVFAHLDKGRANLIVRCQVCLGRHELYAEEYEGWKGLIGCHC